MSSVKATLAAALLTVGMAAPAFAQVAGQISDVQGDVIVERAGEYFASQNFAQVADGDCVTALDAASARIETANGCAFDLDANQSVIVKADATCDAAFVSGVCSADFEQQELALGILPLLIGAAAITATIVAIADDDDDDEPTSP